jgi:hypothetical protein
MTRANDWPDDAKARKNPLQLLAGLPEKTPLCLFGAPKLSPTAQGENWSWAKSAHERGFGMASIAVAASAIPP